MYVVITILIVLVCVLLTLFVLVQNPKGGGLGAGFGGGSSSVGGGVQQTTDFLERSTWTLVIILFFLSILSNAFIPNATDNTGGTDTQIEMIDEE